MAVAAVVVEPATISTFHVHDRVVDSARDGLHVCWDRDSLFANLRGISVDQLEGAVVEVMVATTTRRG